MNQQSNIARVEELEAFAALEGLTLPMPAIEIVWLEDMGFVIDLRTGQILEDVNPDEPIEFEFHEVKHG